MKPAILLFILLVFISKQSFSQVWQWTHPEPNGLATTQNSNTDAFEYDYAHNIEKDSSGNIYVLGNFTDSLYLNNSLKTKNNGSYLAKYDSTGKLLWYKTIIPTDFSQQAIRATDLTVNATGIFITGRYMPTGYECSATCPITGAACTIHSYQIGNISFNSDYNEIGYFVTKFNANGNVVWNKLGTAPDCLNGLYQSPYIVIGDNPSITSDAKGNIICELMYPGNYANVINVGSDIAIPNRTNNAALIIFKMNSAGIMQWSNYAANTTNTYSYESDCNSIITDKNGNTFLYGRASDSCLFGSQIFRTKFRVSVFEPTPFATFLAKISSAGNWQFVHELCNYSNNVLTGEGAYGTTSDYLTVDDQNNIYALVNGQISPLTIYGDTVPSPGATNGLQQYLVKIDNNGNLIFHEGFANTEATANSIAYGNNSVYITGQIAHDDSHKLNFGNLFVQPANNGVHEYYIANADTKGNFQWATTFSGNGQINEGYAVRVLNDNIYTSGYYNVNLTSLGNLNGSFNYPAGGLTCNLFLGKLKDEYIRIGTVAPAILCAGGTITIPFTSHGLTFSGSNTFTAELSDANGDFTNAVPIGSTTSTGSGSITGTIPANLPPYTSGYMVRIRSSDTLPAGADYYAYADINYGISLICPAPSAGFTASNVSANSATLKWNAIECAKGYKIQYKIKRTKQWATVAANTNAGTLNITGLAANATYQWRVATKCKPQATVYFSGYSAIQEFTTPPAFALDKINKDANAFNIIPNPAHSSLTVFLNTQEQKVLLQVVNESGQTIMQKEINGYGETATQLDVSKLSSGTYMLLVKTNKGIQTKEFVKQ